MCLFLAKTQTWSTFTCHDLEPHMPGWIELVRAHALLALITVWGPLLGSILSWHWGQDLFRGTLSPQEDNSHQDSILPIIHNTLTSKPSCMYFRVNPSVNVTEIMFPWITSADVKAQYTLCLLLPVPHYDLDAHSCFNTALLVQTPKPSQASVAWSLFSPLLFTDCVVVLHRHCGLLKSVMKRSSFWSFDLSALWPHIGGKCGLVWVAAVVSLFNCAERWASGAAVVCLSFTSVMAERQHKTNPARKKGGERGMGAGIVLYKEVRSWKWRRI